jgi:poly(3-hydroxybutyrate) depolymerase
MLRVMPWIALALVVLGSPQTVPVVLKEGLTISIPRARRSPVHVDPVESLIVQGTWQAPVEGGAVGSGKWSKITAANDGWFQGQTLGSGYVHVPYDSDSDRVALLEASGSSVSYVNGEPRVGDPYQYGYVSLPVHLKKGRNDLLFLCGRGRLRVQMVEPPKPVSLDLRDPTTPDLTADTKGEVWAAVVVRNATPNRLTGAQIITIPQSGKKLTTTIGSVASMSVRKVGFRLDGAGSPKLSIKLVQGVKQLDIAKLELRRREPGQTYKRTFISEIDGSVQYYGVNPSRTRGLGQALFLSLHGASVEAIGQADAYAPKDWGHLVAPTNRRPFGFDWEEVGRLDALEVLADARTHLKTDPTKIYLTGHSMGGHGTWQLGAHYPNLFAAVGPSAGWISFSTYAGGATYQNPTPIEQMLMRAGAASDTLALKSNFANRGVYVLHGDADDNVPVSEARNMRAALEPLVSELLWHEQKGAGHWWDDNDEPGAACVDWPAMFDLFARRRLPDDADVRTVEFATINPGISSKMNWVAVEQQIKMLVPSTVSFRYDPLSSRFVGTTSNVARLSFDLSALQPSPRVACEIDGQKMGPLPWPETNRLWFQRDRDRWLPAAATHPLYKNPSRSGGFKDVFRNRFMLVYGTGGTAEQNEWAWRKARFDAEMFWYRGNGSVDVVADTDIDALKDVNRNVILYGTAKSNKAWSRLLPISPVMVTDGSVRAGNRSLARHDAAALFIYPRAGSTKASVAVIGGSGMVGMRLADRLPIFTSGAAFPDFLLVSAEMLEKGTEGVRALGFFGLDWKVETGEIVWRD